MAKAKQDGLVTGEETRALLLWGLNALCRILNERAAFEADLAENTLVGVGPYVCIDKKDAHALRCLLDHVTRSMSAEVSDGT